MSALAFLLGVFLIHISTLFFIPLLLVFLLAALVFYYGAGWRWLMWLLLGWCWASSALLIYQSRLLPAELEGKDLRVRGVVVSLLAVAGAKKRFLFQVGEWQKEGVWLPVKWRLKLSEYGQDKPLRGGESWSLLVRLKRPHGFKNPAGFDYQRWLMMQGIHATGYVRPKAERVFLGETSAAYGLLRWRQTLSDQLQRLLPKDSLQGILRALVLADRNGIEEDQWRVLRKTGTAHLVAISGLHIGLAAALGHLLASLLWRCLGGWRLRIGRLVFAAYFALLFALVYAALAGFSLPTQRALIMLSVWLGAVIFQRPLKPLRGLSLALLGVLLLDPLAAFSASFWLSFSAVALIFYLFVGRLQHEVRWLQWGRLHLALALGLSPLLLLFFQQSSVVAPLANLLSVPWMTMVVVPLSLLATLILPLDAAVSGWLFEWANSALWLLWLFLQRLADVPWAAWPFAVSSLWLLPSTILALLLLFAPRGFPARWLFMPLLMPLLLYQPQRPKQGELFVTVLDVGQGLSVLLQTQQHTLLYDTGAKFSVRFDAARAVIIPLLRQQRIKQIDRLILSHDDGDHVGALPPLLDVFPVKQLSSGQPERWPHLRVDVCRAGQSWVWDEVRFEFLHPTEREEKGDNNYSCLLKVTTQWGSVLLTGDIEKPVEKSLLRAGADLQAAVLIAAHHGSNSSSSLAFIQAVRPQYVIYSTGYKNRFHLPHPSVVARFQTLGVVAFNTAEVGAVRVHLASTLSVLPMKVK
ncbi:MAG: DNA internalization-related competence protein ComEC/Rec2 [Gammaproteobacteria bacterium]|nr:DNA internalization-related competence protein ComEC/Rec2 [Gammaproteobacteria bacterium]